MLHDKDRVSIGAKKLLNGEKIRISFLLNRCHCMIIQVSLKDEMIKFVPFKIPDLFLDQHLIIVFCCLRQNVIFTSVADFCCSMFDIFDRELIRWNFKGCKCESRLLSSYRNVSKVYLYYFVVFLALIYCLGLRKLWYHMYRHDKVWSEWFKCSFRSSHLVNHLVNNLFKDFYGVYTMSLEFIVSWNMPEGSGI